MWSEISKLIGANPITTLVIIIAGTSTIWMYKEFKEMINQNNKAKINNINEKIRVYSQLQASTAGLLHDKGHRELKLSLINKIGDFSPFLSEDVRRVVMDYHRYGDPAYLETMLAFIEVDVRKLEEDKKRLSEYDSTTDVEGFIKRLSDPFKPIMMIWLLLWFLLLGYIKYQSQDTWYSKLFVGSFFTSIFVSAIAILAVITLIKSNVRDKGRTFKWFLFGYIILSPVLIFIYEGLSILSLVTQIVSFYLLIRIQKNKKNMIITFD
ncbi:hypothetical protein [Paenibacillus sp. FSL W7-1332]|uniref:hypothetical protein n=1 Tax=Paenibacillus sp. FSL W7-1332 TaxID=2921702 RepID=UPI0030D5B34E